MEESRSTLMLAKEQKGYQTFTTKKRFYYTGFWSLLLLVYVMTFRKHPLISDPSSRCMCI
ncbi:unnamed protein product [Musa acuminata subsp. malaccensis]|uniref:(wild Malaysian banana) hypothetical protein n=1 Tax=Musa acuminata subsp. malaccensis TaxID=214687 RepID=A0A804J7Y8_MUSAM|nr:unnamed protein product [Musa acuminata subsp. malaccensis]